MKGISDNLENILDVYEVYEEINSVNLIWVIDYYSNEDVRENGI